ncbi:MAG: protein kinase [Kofleriaceae bacterium]|nr:protein kinase [Kofleriaceae bacterium]
MGGQSAEQIIAGVVLSERLAVTMYGAIHRAQFSGQRNLRGLVVDPKMLAETPFRLALTDARTIATVTALSHDTIVPTFAVESGGADVVVVTRGVGRYVSVQDLITAAKATRKQGKLEVEVAGAIAKSVVEALAVAHKAKVVHGAVHPRSVLLDEDGAVRLGDFIVGRALTTAVAQGADSALWRGLAGYIAPELAVGEDPTPAADVFAAGAMLFTMLTGDVPPGTLHTTPAVERLVQRSLDTDTSRRYKNAQDLLENLLEAFEDDRWELADRGEVIKAAGLSATDTNIDDATEDLLASLGSSAVSVTPMRPSMDIRAEAISKHQTRQQTTGSGRLDALLADLDDPTSHTYVEDFSLKRDPISELIQLDPRKREAIIQVKPRVPSLDDPEEEQTVVPGLRRQDAPKPAASRPNTSDESAAMDALAGLDEPVRRVSTAADQAEAAAERLEIAARRAEEAAARVGNTSSELDALKQTPKQPERATASSGYAGARSDTEERRGVSTASSGYAGARSDAEGRRRASIAKPNVAEIPTFEELPTPRLKSRAVGIIALLVVVGGGVGFYTIYKDQAAEREAKKKRDAEARARADEQTRLATESLADRGAIKVSVTPPDASIWVKLGRTSSDALFPLSSAQMHRIRIELDGYQSIDTEILPAMWTGTGLARKSAVNVVLKAVAKDKKTGKSLAEPLPARPPNLAVEPKDGQPGEGLVRLETTPPGAEVWLLIGYGNTAVPFPTIAGRPYELRALMDGHKPGYAQVSAEEWRAGGDPNIPLDRAKKKEVIEKSIELVLDPDAAPPPGDPKKPAKKGS